MVSLPWPVPPYRLRWEDKTSHWFPQDQDGTVIDLLSYNGTPFCTPDNTLRPGVPTVQPPTLAAGTDAAGAGRAGDPDAGATREGRHEPPGGTFVGTN